MPQATISHRINSARKTRWKLSDYRKLRPLGRYDLKSFVKNGMLDQIVLQKSKKGVSAKEFDGYDLISAAKVLKELPQGEARRFALFEAHDRQEYETGLGDDVPQHHVAAVTQPDVEGNGKEEEEEAQAQQSEDEGTKNGVISGIKATMSMSSKAKPFNWDDYALECDDQDVPSWT
jgi:hypothetical protein